MNEALTLFKTSARSILDCRRSHHHRPEHTEFYGIVAEHFPRFVEEIVCQRSPGTHRLLAVVQRAISTFVVHHSGRTVACGARTR